jgi:hypothetical protein
MCEVVVNLPPHALDLLAHGRGQIMVPGGFGPFGFLREHGQRRLQAVGQVAGL